MINSSPGQQGGKQEEQLEKCLEEEKEKKNQVALAAALDFGPERHLTFCIAVAAAQAHKNMFTQLCFQLDLEALD
jgi:hypothetical protein